VVGAVRLWFDGNKPFRVVDDSDRRIVKQQHSKRLFVERFVLGRKLKWFDQRFLDKRHVLRRFFLWQRVKQWVVIWRIIVRQFVFGHLVGRLVFGNLVRQLVFRQWFFGRIVFRLVVFGRHVERRLVFRRDVFWKFLRRKLERRQFVRRLIVWRLVVRQLRWRSYRHAVPVHG
jgi:hypothetical protein